MKSDALGQNKKKSEKRTKVALIGILSLSACGSAYVPSSYQTLPLASGSFAIPFSGEIVSIDPIGFFPADGGYSSSYSVSLGSLALEILLGDASLDATTVDSAVREFGAGVVSEVEEYARSRSCVFTIRTNSSAVMSAIGGNVMQSYSSYGYSSSDSTAEYSSIDPEYLESEEFNSLSDSEKFRILNASDSQQTGQDFGTDFAVLSQCLIWAQVGDSLRLAKFTEYVGIIGHVPVQSPPSDESNSAQLPVTKFLVGP